MKTLKFKHLSFEDRCTIEEYLNHNFSFTDIANRIGKDRRCVSREVFKHRFLRKTLSNKSIPCPRNSKPPYVCNGCPSFSSCSKIRYTYDASIAHNEYRKTIVDSRTYLKISKEDISIINEKIAPLMIEKHHSINQVFINHPDILSFSKSTFYKYIDLGIFDITNTHLRRKVRFKCKKEIDEVRPKTNTSIKVGRFYRDFQDYMELHPTASIVEMDTVIGTSGGKGGKCFLTLLFRNYNLMLIYLLPYKQAKYVNNVFLDLKLKLGTDEFKRLFEVILTDNGTEFSSPLDIECDFSTGEKLVSLFYCDPSCSWQKGTLEKNHEYIRYVLPKGTSFAGLTQKDCYLLASHINSIPRVSLNNSTPFDLSLPYIGKNNMNIFKIKKIDYDDVNLSIRLLKK